MGTLTANGDSRLSFWPRVREFAVPPSMIETATARRRAGDWAGACAAARFDVDLDLRSVARAHGRELAARIRTDLRHLAPDLLRWHMPRIAPDGLLRPGLTVSLARYDTEGETGGRSDRAEWLAGDAGRCPGGAGGRPDRVERLPGEAGRHSGGADGRPDGASWRPGGSGPPPGGSGRPPGGSGRPPVRAGGRSVHLVVRTPPAWADAGQRISLGLWVGAGAEDGACGHPHPRPSRRFRLDLHRHLWDARRTDELRLRSGADRHPAVGDPVPHPDADPLGPVPQGYRLAVDRWAAEAAILLRAEGRRSGGLTVRFGTRHRLVLDLVDGADGTGRPALRLAGTASRGAASALPVLPDAATWVLPDLEMLRAGLIEADRLHPLVASALVPEYAPTTPAPAADRTGQPRRVDCRGARHRIALVDGVLSALDHDPAEIRREELLVGLGGPPLPCLRAIDEAHRRPDCLTGVRERLDHGDTAGALAVVEGLLGPEATLRDGPLRDELAAATERRIAYGLFRAGLAGPGPAGPTGPAPRRPLPEHRRSDTHPARPRHATFR